MNCKYSAHLLVQNQHKSLFYLIIQNKRRKTQITKKPAGYSKPGKNVPKTAEFPKQAMKSANADRLYYNTHIYMINTISTQWKAIIKFINPYLSQQINSIILKIRANIFYLVLLTELYILPEYCIGTIYNDHDVCIFLLFSGFIFDIRQYPIKIINSMINNIIHMKEQKQTDQQQHHHIGIKSTKLCSNFYNMQLLTYMPRTHLLLNHGEDLFVYQSKAHQLNSFSTHNHHAPYIKSTYSSKWKCVFLLDSVQKISVFSFEELVLLVEDVDIKSIRHCIDFMFMDQYGAFLVLMPDCIKMVYVQIVSNHLRSLFKNAFKFKMSEKRVKVFNTQYFLQFSNKITKVGEYLLLSNSQDVKIIWYANDNNFNQKYETKEQKKTKRIISSIFAMNFDNEEENHAIKHSRSTIINLNNVCESPEQVSYTFFDPEMHLVICGTSLGKFKVYKINIKNIIATSSRTNKSHQINLEAKSQQAFKLELHNSKPIININMYNSKIVLSMGADEYIEVVSLDQMAAIQKFKSSTHLSSINFISNSTYLAVKTIGFDQYLYSYQIALDYQLLMQHNSQISHSVYHQNNCLIVLTDNSVNQIQLGLINPGQKQLESIASLPKQSFVPPRCKSILCIELFPYKKPSKSSNASETQQQLWILTDQSQIYRYSITTKQNTERSTKFQIVGILELFSFIDGYGHQTKQKVFTMKFLDLVPVVYDSDIKEKTYQPNFNSVQDVQPIALGCQTGELLICSSLQPNKIISRVRHFGQPVLSIASCHFPQSISAFQDKSQNFMQQKIILNESNSQTVPHRRRLIIYHSFKEVVAVMMSNYDIPTTVYKIILPENSFFMKSLPPSFVCIVNGNTPQIMFPCQQQPTKMRVLKPRIALHESAITCLQHCEGINIISGDQQGKIALWNLYSQVLVTVIVSEAVCIESCYCWGNKLMFGYNAKIFEMNISTNINSPLLTIKNEKIQKQKQQFFLLCNNKWIQQFSTELSMQVNSFDFAISKQISAELSARQKSIQKQQEAQSKQLQKYVSKMKKSLIKLTHEVQSHQPQPNLKNRILIQKKIKSKSTSKNMPSSYLYSQLVNQLPSAELPNSKISRAKSILTKFKQSQLQQDTQASNKIANTTFIKLGGSKNDSNQISLPQIKNQFTQTQNKFIQVYTEQKQQGRKRKSRNNKYEFLFHFPNAGLYTQLISKNMIK